MKIKDIRVTPLRLETRVPYVWSQGVENAFTVNLIEIEAEDGTIGYGETTAAPDADAQKIILLKLAKSFIGRSVFDITAARDDAYKRNFLVFGGNMPRYANQLFCGLEMAAMDLQGKLLNLPVWDLLGGEQRKNVGYFYFLQGESTEELVADAKAGAEAGHPIIYLKVGISPDYDLANIRAIRDAIGPDHRLRLDANEAWDPALGLRMLKAIEPYNIEYVEQPTTSLSLLPLKHLKDRSPIALGADQSVFTLQDVYQACATGAADMIAVGPREIGGLRAMLKAAAICEGAGLTLCIHSSMTTGITTCAEHHIGRAAANLDDGNQIMWQLLKDNIIDTPSLEPQKGALSLEGRPGLGFDLNLDVVAKTANTHQQFVGTA
ncbi:Muconate cycloisomerase 1 [Falsiruegeria litorea R37]|uniref:Muconate cycloisomerase 1 n=1 Tax=Falsiruegeria litorea R37 TaxID=1200284 RepID=A0A1Y5RY66_9RHOB|nr:mandelate racemase/muconate lactonizing enzyme family protein [Falsiruegeria litorea]SLN25346.1 Muconate cycloisomerase 1 [Falsiruegeria litorea R37]